MIRYLFFYSGDLHFAGAFNKDFGFVTREEAHEDRAVCRDMCGVGTNLCGCFLSRGFYVGLSICTVLGGEEGLAAVAGGGLDEVRRGGGAPCRKTYLGLVCGFSFNGGMGMGHTGDVRAADSDCLHGWWWKMIRGPLDR